jgi:hypothetical protein
MNERTSAIRVLRGPLAGSTCLGFRNEEPSVVGAAKREVHRRTRSAGYDAVERFGVRAQAPDRAETLMGDEKATFDIKRQTIRAAGAAMQRREDADLGDEAALVQRHAPDLVRPRHRYQEGGLVWIDHDAVRAGDRVDEAGQPSIRVRR